MSHARVIAALIAAVMLLILVVFGPVACNAWMSANKRADVAEGQGKAGIDAGAEAMNATAEQAKNEQESRQTAQGGIDEIRASPPGDSNDASLRASCRMRVYRDSQRCSALRAADSGKPADAR